MTHPLPPAVSANVAEAGHHPKTALPALPLLSDAERHRLVVEWNDTQTDYPKEQCVHQLFETQVARTPEAVAVRGETQQLSYRELNTRANKLAHYLRSLGVGPEILVGIYLERSLDLVISVLAILKAGGAYVPLDLNYPTERLRFILEDTQTPVIVTHRRHSTALPAGLAQRVFLDEDQEQIAQESNAPFQSGTNANHLAYVLYTSGSTGVPKEVMVEHQGLVNYLTWCLRAYPVTAGHGAPLHSSLAFDLTMTSFWTPLLSGQSVYLINEDSRSNGLQRALQQSPGFSLIKLTPAHLRLLSQQLTPQDVQGRTRAFIIGGEELQAEQLTFWREHAPDIDLINEYGPTETVVGCCVYQVPHDRAVRATIPIGRPIQNTQLYILDAAHQPVPIGVVGELYIGGDGVTRGYLRRPELTAAKFLPDPFSNRPGARLYRSGDRARYLPDGNIEFLGRIDNQVKVRGFRIELGEIEAVLDQHPAVQATVVLAREDKPGDKRLVAYIVPVANQKITYSELYRFLRERVPEYMMPAAFVLLDRLPLTPNGKIDRQALPLPESTRPDLEHAFVAPRTPEEEAIADIWREVLGLEQVGIHDNFFALGGHSLKAAQVFARLRTALQIEFPLRTVFETPTVTGLTARVTQSRQQTGTRAELEQLLTTVESLSEEEAQQILQKEALEKLLIDEA